MIKITNLSKNKPYLMFREHYLEALKAKQKFIEAVAISSYDELTKQVDSRFVNLKYINNDQWTFFSNYNSSKAEQFISNSNISALFYWNSINVQIRIKANIFKSSVSISDEHFGNRSLEKNSLAISSRQSKVIKSYEAVQEKYLKILNNTNSNKARPEYWGGYTFVPFQFEFWEGHQSRLNKRILYKSVELNWEESFLEP